MLNQSSRPKAKDVEKQDTYDSENITVKQSAFEGLGWLDRFLAIWIFLAMAIGIILGNFVENMGAALQRGKFVGVSIPIGMFSWLYQQSRTWLTVQAIGLLVMMYPILCKVRYESLYHVFRERRIWVQIAFSIFVNWIIAPFLMVRRPLQFVVFIFLLTV